MRHFLAWAIAVAIAVWSSAAAATCKQIGRRRAVCSRPDGEGYIVGIDGTRTQRPNDAREVEAAKPVGSFDLEGGVGPVMWSSLVGAASVRPAVGGEAFVRSLYAWRPRDRGMTRVGAALATAFVGDHVGLQFATAVAAIESGAIGRARVGTTHRIALGRFWVPAMLSLLPSVGVVHERSNPAQLDLTTELPFGIVATKHVGVELRPGVFHRRGFDGRPQAGVALSLAIVLF